MKLFPMMITRGYKSIYNPLAIIFHNMSIKHHSNIIPPLPTTKELRSPVPSPTKTLPRASSVSCEQTLRNWRVRLKMDGHGYGDVNHLRGCFEMVSPPHTYYIILYNIIYIY